MRGQNIPVDAQELAERERKRQVALAHQQGIRQQLEERERKRREEREQRIREEHEEELRIERDQEIERKRREEELRQLKLKEERERKRNEAIQEAIELAQKEAELLKHNKKVKSINSVQNLDNNETEIIRKNENFVTEGAVTTNDKTGEPEQLNNMRKTPVRTGLLSNDITNNLEIKGRAVGSPRPTVEQFYDNNVSSNAVKETNSQFSNNNVLPNSVATPRTENMTVLLQQPPDTLPNYQYAILVPVLPQQMPIVPSSVPQSARSCSTTRTENRILTPTLYRNKNVMLSDSSTQTEESVFPRPVCNETKDRYMREKLTNLELSVENRFRKERRSRSESLGERPKWGANRPPTRYLKQSEKDLLYQRKKIRQKVREAKSFDYKNSSDDSQPGSPLSYRRNSYSDKRTRALWRKQDQIFNRSIRMYQTEIVPLESDRGQIIYRSDCCCTCTCTCARHRCSNLTNKVDMLEIEHYSPRDKTVNVDKLPEVRPIDNNVHNKFSEVHSGLVTRDEEWEPLPSTPSPFSGK